jgi:hypothetical protein
MAQGFCWRLLAVTALIFVGLALLHGQARVDQALPSIYDTNPSGLLADPIWNPRYPILRDPAAVAPSGELFPHMANAAGIIFSGQVVSVGRAESLLIPGPASTTITFRVEHAMRGVWPGQRLTIHEWSGLWARGERYRVGEEVVLFLFPPSRLGLTSPVAGRLGRFEVARGRVQMGGEHGIAFSADGLFKGRDELPFADFARAVRRATTNSGREE